MVELPGSPLHVVATAQCGMPKLTGVPDAIISLCRQQQNNMFKVIVAGGRDFNNYQLLKKTLDNLLSLKTDVEIVSGMATGADSLAVKYAKETGRTVAKFPAKWKTDGNSAGFKRNKVMALYADACVCFWDGKSKGTAHMILIAKHYNLRVRIIKY